MNMNMNRRVFLGGLSAAALLPLAGMPAVRAASLPPDAFYGRSFPNLQGGDVALSDYLGKPMVLNFWATWCPPCVKEMPDLDALHAKHPGVHFVGLAVDTATNVERFIQKVQVSYSLLVAGHGGIQSMRELGNKQGGLPFTVVFDAAGHVAHRILGQVKPDELDRFLTELAA